MSYIIKRLAKLSTRELKDLQVAVFDEIRSRRLAAARAAAAPPPPLKRSSRSYTAAAVKLDQGRPQTMPQRRAA
jgi:hypothetical protein